MTQLTQRQDSILRMFAIMDTVKYSGGDWDDHLAAQVDALPMIDKLAGITQEEYDTLHEAYSCPRMVSELIGDLRDEVDGLSSPSQHILDADIQDQIDKLQAVIDALKIMKVYQGTLKDKYWTSQIFDDLDKLGSDVKHSEETIEWEDDHYVDFSSDDVTKHKGAMMEYELLKIDIEIRIREY